MSIINENSHIILASASPRRREILSSMGVRFTVVCADADETCDITDPRALTLELAQRKGQAVYSRLLAEGRERDAIIISADTVVACGTEILGKPHDRADAQRMLRMLSGNTHVVATGVAVTVGGVTHSDCSITHVHVDSISDEEIQRYIDTENVYDKAGAYGIQGAFSKWVTGIEGCYFGVVGLPVNCLMRLFKKTLGYSPDLI